MYFDPKQNKPHEISQFILGGVSPRPIAWVSTQDKNGNLNLAPFSFFIAVSFNPPVIAFSQITPRDKPAKDTILNLEEFPECVVNIPSLEIIKQMNLTSGEYDRGVNEFELAGLTELKSKNISVPGVKEAKIRYECKVREIIKFGNSPAGSGIMPLLDVVGISLSDEMIKDGEVDWNRLNAIGRMHGNFYSTPCHQIELAKPS